MESDQRHPPNGINSLFGAPVKHKSISITNYKGIRDITINFGATPQARVHTLVGLNESGKTTVLEAFNLLNYTMESLTDIVSAPTQDTDPFSFIPISQRTNFNGQVKVAVEFALSQADQTNLKQFIESELNLMSPDVPDAFTVTEAYKFKDSRLLDNQPTKNWNIVIRVKKSKRATTLQNLTEFKSEGDNKWQAVVNWLKPRMPAVLYFPNFLFDIPDRIYLTDQAKDDPKHKFYRAVISDGLKTIDPKISIQDHVVVRLLRSDDNDKSAIESLQEQLAATLTATIFGNWNKIFNKNHSDKRIRVSCTIDEDSRPVMELRIVDGSSIFRVSERSLGFRWFFAFLLLTSFRGLRDAAGQEVLILLDEPASNLHSTAQARLLQSFSSLPNCRVVYTTHSHHMINPAWLESTYVVKNEGFDVDKSDDFVASATNIALHRYRQFVADHPDQTTYYKPILEVLEYKPGPLENIPDVVMLEGKNDTYGLMFAKLCGVTSLVGLNLMPGGGATSLKEAIRLYLAWGRRYVVLLDSDNGGKAGRNCYEKEFGCLCTGSLFLLDDVDTSFSGKGLEFVIDQSDQLAIINQVDPSAITPNKTALWRAIQELLLLNRPMTLSSNTMGRFEKIGEFLGSHFQKK